MVEREDFSYMYFVAIVPSLSRVQLFATPWTAARQVSLSFTISQSLFMSIELVMLSNHMCFNKIKFFFKSSSPKGCLPFKSPRRKPAGSPPGIPAAGRSSHGKTASSVFLSSLELSLPPWEYLTFLFQNQHPWVLRKNSENHWFSTSKQQVVGSRYVQYSFRNCRMDFFTSQRRG